MHEVRLTQLRRRVDAGFAGLGDQGGDRAGGRVETAQLQLPRVAGVLQEVHGAFFRFVCPPCVHERGVVHDRRGLGLLSNHAALGDVEDVPRHRRHPLFAGHRVPSAVFDGATAVGRCRFDEHELGYVALIDALHQDSGEVG